MTAVPFSFRSGSVTDTTAKIGMFTPSDSDVTIAINGAVYTLSSPTTLVGRGTDSEGGANDSGVEPALYTGVASITGLSTNRTYPYTVTQDGITRTGSLSTNPAGRFSIFFITCDGRYQLGSDTGCWPYIRKFAEANKVCAIVHADDHGYTDTMQVDDRGAGGSGQWILSNPQTRKTVFARVLSYAAYLGLLESDDSGQEMPYVPRFHEADRIWCWQNIPIYSQVGDHEFKNNPEESAPDATLVSSGKTAWLETLGITNPHIDTNNGLAWVHRIGPLEIISYDRVTELNNSGGSMYTAGTTQASSNAAGTWSTGDQYLGANQIADILGEVDTTTKFKLLAMTAGSKFLLNQAERIAAFNDASWAPEQMGSQQPLHDYSVDSNGDSDWTELMTKKPDSLATKAAAAGAKIIGLHGDTHRPYVYYHFNPETPTHSQLEMIEVSAGTVNGQGSQYLHGIVKPGKQNGGCQCVWLPDWIETVRGEDAVSVAKNNCIRLDVNTAQDELTISILESDGTAAGTEVIYSKVVSIDANDALPAMRQGFI